MTWVAVQLGAAWTDALRARHRGRTASVPAGFALAFLVQQLD